VANVVSRPVLRSWEIPFLGRAGAPVERQLPLSDLRVSVRGDRVVLRSVRLDREVVPRLTSAHMAGPHSAAAYRFLKSVEYQDSAAQSGWSWGVLEDAEYLPRVRAGRLVLALAEWRLRGGRLRPLAEAKTVVARLQAARRLREELQLPRFVLQVEGDNVLPLDLDNPLCIEALAHGVGVKPLTLREMFPGPDALCAAGPEGRFVHEFVVPFLRERAPSPPPRRVRPVVELPRVLPPGSEWLYAKIYCGGTVADRLLVERLGPWLKEAEATGEIDRWFFLRYRDPEAHLRLRVHGTPERLLASVLPALLERLRGEVAERAAWRVQLDTYVREVERYGGPEGMLLSERLFHADSAAALELVGRFQHEEGADARWRLALAGCHLLLEDLEVPLPERVAFLDLACEGLEREHGAGAYTEAALGKRYRVERPALEALLAGTGPLVEALAPLWARSARSRPVIAELRTLERDGKLGVGWGELAASYVHMHVNRLIRSAPRAHELVLYDFLRRLYRSRISRSTAGR
jgi:thiopeptide-type bacteriocin biosynthesis protein